MCSIETVCQTYQYCDTGTFEQRNESVSFWWIIVNYSSSPTVSVAGKGYWLARKRSCFPVEGATLEYNSGTHV